MVVFVTSMQPALPRRRTHRRLEAVDREQGKQVRILITHQRIEAFAISATTILLCQEPVCVVAMASLASLGTVASAVDRRSCLTAQQAFCEAEMVAMALVEPTEAAEVAGRRAVDMQ